MCFHVQKGKIISTTSLKLFSQLHISPVYMHCILLQLHCILLQLYCILLHLYCILLHLYCNYFFSVTVDLTNKIPAVQAIKLSYCKRQLNSFVYLMQPLPKLNLSKNILNPNVLIYILFQVLSIKL